MPFDHDQVIQAQFQQLAAARAKALGDYEAARLNDDSDGTMDAADRILAADERLRALDRVAQNLVRQAPLDGADDMSRGDVALARQFGLSGRDLSIAKNWTTDPNLTDAQKVQTYLENRQRYQQARADGSYRDDQGRVTR
jgi:hypothetical protein